MTNRPRKLMKPYQPHTERQLQAGRNYAIEVGWARGRAEEAEAREQTGDRLTERLGPKMQGAVKWKVAAGEDAWALLGMLKTRGGALANPEHVDECRRLMRTYGGRIVVAIAEVKPEQEPAEP